MQDFTNFVVAITGGNSGIGLETAIAFKAKGAKVAIFGRDQATLDHAAQAHGFVTHKGDVINRAQLEAFFLQVKTELGAVDAVFANAGIAEFLPFEAAPSDHYDRVFDVNVKGVINTVQAALPVLNTPASIVLTTSVANRMGEPNTSVYSASKAAVRSLAKTLSTELLPRGVRVNCISPGPTDTPIFSKMGLEGAALDGTKDFIATRIPAGRMGQSADVAQAVLYLASKEAGFVAGTEIVVDGGFSNSAVLPS
ncbi:SDR family oxidoreductase [Cognatishimia sp. WU-CL00825]|uniref:SDR family oxidoreductase n=1 Tax=Cognatishimia sp. WU-CL00825 TaxID=3127658 RepID=UPI003104AE71